ncbi:copper homeostasis membrane protein CopD [Brevundimonas sp.]|uniref:copper homeostasis membrane protein CopD n=1 Tax=Brevundimonas sp. TaxID=1871086 RepID=UPI002D6D2B19|nr:copper homeostasis membrane protein CopD [Brevundimonas sp.]HYC97812.1 copper homeostasis membrane protein CopD [Brevundimonas sp.]
MTEAALVGLRAIQYAAAAIVLGVPAFMLYGRAALAGARSGWAGRLIRLAAAVLLLATLAALVVQTAVMAGSLVEAVKPETLGFMITGTALGAAYAARAALALLALMLALSLRFDGALWRSLILPALLIGASFAWTGHGGATEGPWRWPHLAADVVHAIAALIWIGALAAFVALARRRKEVDAPVDGLAAALVGFANIGTLAVSALVLSGLVNVWVLVGPDALPALLSTAWGQLLAVKLAAFAGMLGLATLHRYRLAPALSASGVRDAPSLGRLRRTLAVEFALGLAILGLVAAMGLLPPPASL